jgi:hypothetical protein
VESAAQKALTKMGELKYSFIPAGFSAIQGHFTDPPIPG